MILSQCSLSHHTASELSHSLPHTPHSLPPSELCTCVLSSCGALTPCTCAGVSPRVKSGRFMKLLPDYEHMDYRDVYTRCMYSTRLCALHGCDFLKYSLHTEDNWGVKLVSVAVTFTIFFSVSWVVKTRLLEYCVYEHVMHFYHEVTGKFVTACFPVLTNPFSLICY